MKTLRVGMICVALTLLMGAPALAQTGHDLLQQALVMEQAEGDLQAAIQLYERIVQEFGGDGALAARALVQMGQCYEKLGSQEAERAYRRVVSDYGDQREFVEQARSRLLALTQPPPTTAASTIQLRLLMAGRINTHGGPYPDGRHLVRVNYDTGGLAVRDLVTGETQQITPGDYDEGEATSASVSPDGKLIKYLWYPVGKAADHFSGTMLRLVGTDGSGDRFLQFVGGNTIWSRDSRHIAANMHNPENTFTEIVWISVEDGSITPLETFQTPSRIGLHSSHSPDDRFLAVEYPVVEDSARFDIALVSTEGGGTLGLVVDHPADDWLIGWVPGTDAVLFKSDRSGSWDLWAVRVSEEGIPGIPFSVRRGIGEMDPMGFAADGSLFYSNYTQTIAKSVAPFDERSGRVFLESAEPIMGDHDILSFGWSPDGGHLALAYREEDSWIFDPPSTIRVRDMNSGAERVLTRDILPSPLEGLLWTPDGRSILTVGMDPEVAGGDQSKTPAGLFSIDVETGETTRLFEFPSDEDWTSIRVIPTPDGQGVIYNHRGRLVRRDLESGREEELYRHPDLSSGLSGTTGIPPGISMYWSPDGSELLFWMPDSTVTSPAHWGKRLMIMPSRGGEPYELLKVGGPGRGGDFNWSLDGRHILYLQREEGVTALMRVPREGGDPERLWETDVGILRFPLSPDHQNVGILALTMEAEIWVMENLVAVLREGGGGR